VEEEFASSAELERQKQVGVIFERASEGLFECKYPTPRWIANVCETIAKSSTVSCDASLTKRQTRSQLA
jgi:hypothetical protein